MGRNERGAGSEEDAAGAIPSKEVPEAGSGMCGQDVDEEG